MPGPFAHMGVIRKLALSRNNKDYNLPSSLQELLNETEQGKGFDYCSLGSVSPDYPYFDWANANAKKWADVMHYDATRNTILKGVEYLTSIKDKPNYNLCKAWFLGYVAHLITDMVIHPVVECIIGVYKFHKDDHRSCEMHQDSFIWKQLTGLEICEDDYIDKTLKACSPKGSLNQDVIQLWKVMLDRANTAEYVSNTPDPNKWHDFYANQLDIAIDLEELRKVHLLLKAIVHQKADRNELFYPFSKDVADEYIKEILLPPWKNWRAEGEALPIPADCSGKGYYYDAYFYACRMVRKYWLMIEDALNDKKEELNLNLDNWNLDTGRSNQSLKYAFWPQGL